MTLTLTAATPEDAKAVAALRTAAAHRLTREHGHSHWSSEASEKGVLTALRKPGLFVAREGATIVATLSLITKKPWAIDPAYFTAVTTPLYLLGMAVAPDRQRQGIGRRCIDEAERIAREWPADAIRLDAYDADAGAWAFYARCGFREVGRVTYRKVPLIYYERLISPS